MTGSFLAFRPSTRGKNKGTMEIVFSLCLPRDEASVPVVRHVCRDCLRMLGVGAACVGEIELAVTEACTNVLKHVAKGRGEYEVAVEIDEAQCHIRVLDSAGQGFDHDSHGFSDPVLTAEGGRGIFIMRAMVDELRFTTESDSGSAVHLVKNLELEEDSVLERLTVA